MNFSNQKQQKNTVSNTITNKYAKHSLSLAVIAYLFLALFTLASCSKDDDPIADDISEDPIEQVIMPEVTLQSGSEDVFLGVVGGVGNSGLNHVIKADAPEGMVSLTIYSVRDGVVTEYATVSEGHPQYFDGITSFNYQLDYKFKESDVGVNLFFKAEVLDEEGNTASIDFAEASVKLTMLKADVVLQARRSGAYNPVSHYYLYVKDDIIQTLPISEANKEENDTDIVAILSYNDDSGLYIASPTDVDETVLTDNMLEISKTRFKRGGTSVNDLNSDYSIIDTHEIEANFEALSYDENDERINSLKKNARFYFTTEDGRIAILHVRAITPLGTTHTQIGFDMLITQ